MERPTLKQLMEWEEKGGCEATDGCWVEPDGTCEHGCQSWLLVLGLINADVARIKKLLGV